MPSPHAPVLALLAVLVSLAALPGRLAGAPPGPARAPDPSVAAEHDFWARVDRDPGAASPSRVTAAVTRFLALYRWQHEALLGATGCPPLAAALGLALDSPALRAAARARLLRDPAAVAALEAAGDRAARARAAFPAFLAYAAAWLAARPASAREAELYRRLAATWHGRLEPGPAAAAAAALVRHAGLDLVHRE